MHRAILILAVFHLQVGIPRALAKDYPIFDGQKYNGVYYPRIDIIEWGKPPHLEFHVYSKGEPVDIEAKACQRGGKRVLVVNYFFSKRKEKVCRSVIAPENFSSDQKLYFYKDSTDNEYDNIYVSVNPQKTSKNIQSYANKNYSTDGCDTDDLAQTRCEGDPAPAPAAEPKPGSKTADDSSGGEGRGVASTNGQPAPRVLTDSNEGSPITNHVKPSAPTPEKKHELIDYENNAMPYNF